MRLSLVQSPIEQNKGANLGNSNDKGNNKKGAERTVPYYPIA